MIGQYASRTASLTAQLAALRMLETPAAMEDGECWEWPGPFNTKGYGYVAPSLLGTEHSKPAHRVAWLRVRSSLTRHELVCHRCDNPPCFRPSHLFVGSAADNSADMVSKGRQARMRNEKSGMAKVSDAEVAEIRALRASGWTLAAIAAEYPIHPSQVSRICAGKSRPCEDFPRAAAEQGWKYSRKWSAA